MIQLDKKILTNLYRKFQREKEEATWVMQAIEKELKRREKK